MKSEINLKYNQIRLLISAENGFYSTIKPDIREIGTKLYQQIDDSRRHYSHNVDNQCVVSCWTHPIVHTSVMPSLKYILEYIPYNQEYETVFLFFTPLNYTIGNYHISKLEYGVPNGRWVPRTNNRSFCNRIDFDNHLINHGNQIPLSDVSDDELMIRYHQFSPVRMGSDSQSMNEILIYHLDKPPFDEIRTTSYTWNGSSTTSIIGKYETRTKDIMTIDGHRHAEHVCTFPTFHSYAYSGFFKPLISEVMSRLPRDLISINNQYLFTTEPADSNINNVCVGDYHVGATTVWKVLS